ncbi:hypothetical protein Taro_015594 [Colocasia esculenta]|uniref:VWFA domain-containing protein n=1 Tax=Colocasia esculenta TaxID=4460 RepID=A0A843UHT7_COLES|nr:hypothetical protein [Colocasia esculenta]
MAPTTSRNSLRLLRAMQLHRPVLLEGSPGVGKTSLVVALAEFSGHNVVRINLSEQTDMMDLLGSDLPVAGNNGMEFAWSDGILLQALKNGSWVLLDELNLAPQSVLEGLNAILDHRAEVHIPELGATFKCPSSFRVFACQNPMNQGGGRKGLPKSFLNRFTKVYVDELGAEDYLFICQSVHPSVPTPLLSKLINFNSRLYEDTMLLHKYGQEGSPWEFNLRDVIRACQIIEGAPEKMKDTSFLTTLYIQRMRTAADRREVVRLYEEIFGRKFLINQTPRIQINPKLLAVGDVSIPRNYFQQTKVLKRQLNILPSVRQYLEAILHCVQHQWLCILVGPSSSGKSSLLHLVAQLTGNPLHELNLSSGTDVSELLGCFEQYNALNTCIGIFRQIECYMGEYCALRLQSSWESLLTERKSLISRWLALLATINDGSRMPGSYCAVTWKSGDSSFLSLLVEIIEQLKLDLENYHLPVSWSDEDLTRSLKAVLDLQKKIGSQPLANFEWVSGRLVKAIECGEWVVLDNANLCNPTVLDRINSLVEPNGFITVNECGLVDGNPLVLHAHPKFRMFITVDPKYGEVSRAMRNRGVEIFMIEQDWLLDEETSHACREREIVDVKRFLVNSGIPLCNMIETMSEAHMYAKHAGLRIGVRITLLELRRWVQLFQQLLMGGNQPRWSLQLSWEHTYLTSFGEAEGRDIVMHVKNSYLSEYKWSPFMGNSLCLPGGWPLPLNLTKFVWFSQEAAIKQNFIYLEFLGAQCASYELSVGNRKSSLLNSKDKPKPIMFPVSLLCQLLFPSNPELQNFICAKPLNFDLEMTKKMLLISFNWVIEQATGSDLELYIVLFKWYAHQLHPYCSSFKSFSAILDQELAHPIWNYIINSWRDIVLNHQINVNQQFLPLLSDEMTDAFGSTTASNVCTKRLHNSIQCVCILRLSLEQWNAERCYVCNAEGFHQTVLPILESLRHLEEEVLSVISESSFFDHLFHIYSNLLEQHRSFWRHIISSDLNNSAMAWHFLVKEVLKFKRFFPVATNNLLVRSMDLIGKSAWNLYISKPFLWMHGGHPYAPSSVDIFHKKHQILTLCSVIWPRKKFQELPPKDSQLMMDAVLSTNTELRYLAMQGLGVACRKLGPGEHTLFHRSGVGPAPPGRAKGMSQASQSFLDFSEWFRGYSCRFPDSMPGIDCWLECLLLFDKNSLILDMELLQELSRSGFLDSLELFEGISKTSDLLEYALGFSLKYSSRPPTDFAPHQKILWILDAWTSLDSVLTRTANVVHEMWFHWHSSLWYPCSGLPRMQNILQASNDEDCLLVQPVRFAVLEQILRSTHPISGYEVYNFKVKVTSRNLFQDAPPERDGLRYLLAVARSLFQQIIFTHRKSFEEAKFQEIKTTLHHLRENNKENLPGLKALILSSSHSGLTSCMDSFIQPLIKELYSGCMEEYVHSLGLAWVHLGLLRFHLLLNSCNSDPSMKYAFRLSQITERISMLELEIKVRRECELLAGGGLPRSEQDERVCLLKKLEEERRKLQEKVVFRPNPADFENMKIYCYGFLGPQLKFPCNLMNINEVQNWQAKSTQFIHQLSEKYAAYVDIIQPLQVAVYEMKLGLTLIVSNVLENEYLLKVEQNRDVVLATIYSLMQFPGCLMCCADMKSNNTKFMCLDANASASSLAVNLNVLKKLITTISCPGEEKIRSQQLEASIHRIILANVACSVGTSLIMDESSFSLLNEVFVHFAKLWFAMKFQVKMNKDIEDQPFKFRPRAIRVEDILRMDLPSLTEADSDRDYACELEEMPAGGEYAQVDPSLEGKNLEEEWNLIPEDILKGMLQVHGQLFGSSTLSKYGAVLEVTEKEKLQLFVGSYDIGAYIIKGLPTTISAALDEKLVVEQMLRVCLQSAGNMTWFQQSHAFNIYKDPNASVMSKMVEPLVVIQERVKYFLTEWLDHPGLQNILGLTEMLLSIPLDTPLSKALFGLESLLARAQTLQETCPKFSLADHLEPVYLLVYSWQKIELDSWHNLLDGVEEQYEINAGKLWFPLHSVLHRNLSGNVELDTIVEEFIETSSLGEFKKRLQLLLAFHGQFNTGIIMNVYSSSHQKEILSILYNAFGYYIQFLPLVMKHINVERGCKEEEIKNQIKLLKWEHPNTLLSIERFRVARHKLWKLIKKFNDVLQQPVMVFLNQEANIKNSGVSAWFKQKPSVEADKESVPFPVEPTHFGATERLLGHHSWKQKINLAFEASSVSRSSGYDGLQCKEFASPISLSLFSECEGLLASTSKGWASLEKIYRHATDFAHVWKHGTKNLKKRRSLTDLLKLLEASGLLRHRSLIAEIEAGSNQLSTLLCQASYDVQHLLLQDSDSSGEHISYPQMLSNGNSDLKWNTANRYYFKNIAMLQQLRQARLNFHKDLSLEQVKRAMSFIDHLIAIQQDQRSTLYALWEQFRKLKIHSSSLESFGTGELSLSSDQHLLSECMWNQKKLFDKLVTLSKDTSLLLRCIGNSHLNACHAVRVEAETISTFVDKYIHSFVKSKELLDKYLLHDSGIITASVACEIPLIISKQMETFVMENFQIICSFDDDLQNFKKSKAFSRSMDGLLLNHFTELTIKGKLVEKEFLSSLAAKECPMNFCQADSSSKETFTDVNASFTKISVRTINMVKEAILKLVLLWKEQTFIGDMSSEKITSWNAIFEKYISELQLGPICVSFCETIISAGELLNHSGNKDLEVCIKVESQLKHLYVFLDLFLSIVEAIILDFLAVHNTISEMTNMLAEIFALLFSEGFGDSKEQVDDTAPIPQDATGTGMGEGEGMNDVSDQIDDEDQLLGTSEKQNQGPESSEKVPSKSDKEIEMDEDFAADAFSVSEDSEDDAASESEDLNLESVMDQNVDGSQVVDEKLWDKEEEANSEKNMEKYELGSSVKETDPSDREFRGKEDASSDINESGELTDEESERLSGKNENQNTSDDEESSADAKMDESNAFEDSSGIQCNEHKRECEEAGVDEAEDSLALDGVDENMEDETNQSNSVEDHMDLEESGEVEKTEIDEGDEANADDIDRDSMGTTDELTDLQKFEPKIDSLLEKGSFEPVGDSFAVDLNMMPETHLSDGNDLERSFVPSGGLPSDVPRSELSLPDLTHGKMFAADKPKLQSSEDDSLSLQRPAANPYRSIGDALEEWKDRVKISDGSQENQSDVPDNMADNIGDEYQFISEMEKGSSQTLGPATSDQINQSIDRKDLAVDDHVNNEDDIEPMDIIKEYEQEYIKRCETSMHGHKTDEQLVTQLPETGERTEAYLEGSLNDSLVDGSGNIVSFESSFVCEEPLQSSVLTADQSVRREVENAYDSMQHDSLVEWKRYERVTTRLSQELCEQLRLVMEPTLASKLQGDYKTGKRINMKKVIPYIASHFRKDKIWLRRTRPNKRDYQVVVAIDDSRSMSESHCGSFAIEALVTICRAMSQLEVGQFAVTSFGERGNIRLLHDFDQPFTGEAGSKIISSLSFKQDNTIRDEPVVDLLKYLDNMLDTAVSRARLPSGANPLKQLILIIADGRFQDKEKLRRCVRDILSKKRMLAFVLLDNPQESIMDLPEYSFIGGKFSCTKYMDSFPFPYYVVLRNIEALPRTVADLLRQWFQLMQSE